MSDTTSIDMLCKIAGYMRQQRLPYESLFTDACDMFAPELRKDSSGVWEFGRDKFDGYPQQALDTWAKGIPGNMVYRDSKWLTMRLNIRQLAKDAEIRRYCDELSDVTFWAARRSNFYRRQPEFARHAGVMGGYLFPTVNVARGAVDFILEDPWKVWIARDGMGKVMYCMREVTRPIMDWGKEFGMKNLPKEWQNQEMQLSRRKLTHMIFENPTYQPASSQLDNRRWASVYFEEGTKTLINESTLDYGVIDWAVRLPAGWDYPATPAMYAYVDALTNDAMTETLLDAARLASAPPMKVSSHFQHGDALDLGYGGITWVSRPEDIVEQIAKAGSYPAGDAERGQVRKVLDRWFNVPFFEVLTRIEGTPPTAYHIRQLQSEKATLLGPEVGSYREDSLDPSVDILLSTDPELTGDVVERPAVLTDFLYDRIATALDRLGLPFTEENVNGWLAAHPMGTIEAQYNGVLTSIETEVVQNRAYVDGISLIAAAAEIWPEAPLVGKVEKVLQHSLEALSWSQDDMRSSDEFKEAVEQMQESQKMQELAALGKDLAATYAQSSKGAQVEQRTMKES